MSHEFLETLEKDHEEVKELLEKLQSTSKSAMKSKEDLFLKFKQELIPHMKAEEKHFYPVLLDKKGGHEVALESLEEHHVAEMVLKELDSLPKDADNWNAKLRVFTELVLHHIEEEEEEVFDAADDSLEDEELDRIMELFMEEKETLRKKIK